MKIYRPYRVGDGLRRFPPGLNQSARSQPRNHAARLLNIPLHTLEPNPRTGARHDFFDGYGGVLIVGHK